MHRPARFEAEARLRSATSDTAAPVAHAVEAVTSRPSIRTGERTVHLALAQARRELRQIPPQDQIQSVEHRHPPRTRARRLGALAEADVNLAEQSAPEVQVSAIQSRALLRAQPRQVQRAEQGVLAASAANRAAR